MKVSGGSRGGLGGSLEPPPCPPPPLPLFKYPMKMIIIWSQ